MKRERETTADARKTSRDLFLPTGLPFFFSFFLKTNNYCLDHLAIFLRIENAGPTRERYEISRGDVGTSPLPTCA